MTAKTTTTNSRAANAFAVGLLLAAMVGYTWATWQYFTKPVPGGNDFLAHYSAWEAYFRQGINPYSDEAALYTQQAIYGRPALAGEDQNRLTYPFYSALIHAPFIVIDYDVARAIYMVLLQGAVVIGVALTLNVVGWRPPVGLLALVVAWALLNYNEARGVILGQFAIFGFLALAGTLALLARKRDTAAGMLLVLTTVKPTLVFLAAPFLLLWAARQRRWRFLAGFGGLLAALVVVSLLMLPSWIGDFLLRIQQYSGYTVGQSPVWVLTHEWLPGLGTPVELLLTAACGVWLVWAGWRAIVQRPNDAAELQWALGVVLVVSNLVAPRSATTNYALLLTPTIWVLAQLDKQGRGGRAAMVAGLLVSLVGQWWLHLATVQGNQEQAIMFFPWPVALGLALLLARPGLLRAARQADSPVAAQGAG